MKIGVEMKDDTITHKTYNGTSIPLFNSNSSIHVTAQKDLIKLDFYLMPNNAITTSQWLDICTLDETASNYNYTTIPTVDGTAVVRLRVMGNKVQIYSNSGSIPKKEIYGQLVALK